jgi:hypothetical protein
MSDGFKKVTIMPLPTSTYASWRVEMEALLRAQGLFNVTRSSLKTSWPATFKEQDDIETNHLSPESGTT